MENLQCSQDYLDAMEVIGRHDLQSWPIVLMLKTTLAKQFYIDHIHESCQPPRLKVIGPKLLVHIYKSDSRCFLV